LLDSGTLANTIVGLNVDVTTANANDTTYAAIFQGGNVGIGTTSPNARLQINPTVTATADLTSLKSGIVYNGATAMTNWYGGYIAAPTGTGTITNKYAFVTEANSGNVGIGMTGPTSLLHLLGSQPAAVGTTPGTAATDALTITGIVLVDFTQTFIVV